jgi:hypothetical protein
MVHGQPYKGFQKISGYILVLITCQWNFIIIFYYWKFIKHVYSLEAFDLCYIYIYIYVQLKYVIFFLKYEK